MFSLTVAEKEVAARPNHPCDRCSVIVRGPLAEPDRCAYACPNCGRSFIYEPDDWPCYQIAFSLTG